MSSPARTLVFVPLHEEMSHINSVAAERGYKHNRGKFDIRQANHSYIYERPNGQLAVLYFHVLGDAGNARTAAAAAAAIQDRQPEIVLLAGLAGSLDPAQARLGDVFVSDMAKILFADKIKEIDIKNEILASEALQNNNGRDDSNRIIIDDKKSIMGKSYLRFRRDITEGHGGGVDAAEYVTGLSMKAALRLENVTEDIVRNIPHAQRERCINLNPEVRTAVVLASDMVVDSQDYIDFLQDRNSDESVGVYATRGDAESIKRNPWLAGDIPIVDMESYGFFKLVDNLRAAGKKLKALTIRGVSDYAAGKTDLDDASKDQIRKIAVRNAAIVTFDVIKFLDLAEISGR